MDEKLRFFSPPDPAPPAGAPFLFEFGLRLNSSQTRPHPQSFVAQCRQNRDEDQVSNSTSNPDSLSPDPSAREASAANAPGSRADIRARVRAHRSRANRVSENQAALPGMEEAFSPASIAARVAERYARLPSWRDALAAQAAAKPTVDSSGATAGDSTTSEPSQLAIVQDPAEPERPLTATESRPDPYQPDLLRYFVSSDSLPAPRATPPEARAILPASAVSAEVSPLLDPLEEALVEPTQPLPASVITSPRELIAPRKARPRLAEGPLGDDAPAGDPDLQIRPLVDAPLTVTNSAAEHLEALIPDVKAASAFAVRDRSAQAPPEWSSIHLDTEVPIPERRQSPSAAVDQHPLDVASMEDRVLAALVDFALTLSAFLLFAGVFALCSTSLPHGRPALLGAAAALFAMWLIYQVLFFTLTDATPGMRFARIALCTFDGQNPTPSMLRGRIAALLLSALPLGLGFLWAVFDEDALGWHDRITRTYQRSYREA